MRHKDTDEIIPMTSCGCLPHSDEIIKPFVIAKVGMVLGDKVFWMQSLEENGALCFNTNPLVSSGHGGFESCGLRMEVHVTYNYYKFLCKILIGDEKPLF